jgi:two-component system chemotaxis response regulator CheB
MTPTRAADRLLDVLVIDDSAVVRQALGAILAHARGMTVAAAADPIIAMDKMRRRRPDVIVLDLEMPRMDGLSSLRKVMSEDPVPVVVCSGVAGRGTEAALRAMEEGAVEVIAKPKLAVKEFLEESAILLVDAVLGAAAARLRPRRSPARARPRPGATPPARHALRVTTDKVVAIGASTGGTEALSEILQAMPPDALGMVIVQHMPEVLARSFAERLGRLCRVEVKEAATGDRVTPGRALVAPGNRHTVVVRSGAHYQVEVRDGPLVSRHRPSVDVLFGSVAQAAGPNAIGVTLTGMGDDGADGLLRMRLAGAATIAQDEESCVVFGMPKAAIDRGAADSVFPLAAIPGAILRRSASWARVKE